uniref:Uncharacterized protein n=1 Tax=Anguilla anguilla TaxID=7936 RepID=A0A0E9T0D9_ANGAN
MRPRWPPWGTHSRNSHLCAIFHVSGGSNSL